MTTTYSQFTKQSASQKVILVHLHAKENVKVFTTNGMLHTRNPRAFVTEVLVNGISYSLVTGTPTTNEFSYSPTTNLLTIFFDGTIVGQEVILTYRFFFSNIPAKVSYDLTTSGEVVDYKPRVQSVPGFGTQLSFSSSNKTVTGTGNLSLDNADGFFNKLFPTVRFDNKVCRVFSWNPDLAFDENKTIFNGFLHRANINDTVVSFTVKDTIFNLNNQISLPQFTSSEVIAAHRNRFKKSIFGRVNGMAIQSISQIGDGYTLTGTINGNSGDTVITGIGTVFLSELAPRDKVTVGGITFTVRRIIDETNLAIAEELNGSISGTGTVIPVSPWFNTNRIFSVANHLLKTFTTTIIGFVDARRIRVASADDFQEGDVVLINGEERVIDRLSQVYTDDTQTTVDPVIVLSTTLSNLPTMGTEVTLVPVSSVKNEGELFQSDDIVQSVDATETIINISSTAEQDIATEGYYGGQITGIAGTNYFILGIPHLRTYDLTTTASTDFRGTKLILSRNRDTTTSTGTVIWMGNPGEIRVFSTSVAATVNFAAGDIYQRSDGDMEYIGVRTSGVNMDHEVLGENEPLRINLDSGHTFDDVSIELKILIDVNNTETLFNRNGNFWMFMSNIGVVGPDDFTGALVLPTANPPVVEDTVNQLGEIPNVDISLSERVSARDLIRNILLQTEFQVVQAENSFVQISDILDETTTAFGVFKNPNYITDTSLVTCSAIGQTFDGTSNGTFVKTPADVILKALQDNGLTSFINTSTFTNGSENQPSQIGIYVPYDIRSQPPSYTDFINKVSLSGLSAIGLDENFLIKFQLLNGFKRTSLDDIRLIRNNELTAQASQSFTTSPLFRYNISTIEASYDFGEETPNSKLLSITDETITRLTDLETSEAIDLYLPILSEARSIADRYLNYSQDFNRIVSLQGSISLADVNIGDVVLLDILELRNDNTNLPFLGMVTSFQRNGTNINMTIVDFGGLFFRAATISSNSVPAFNSATDDEILLNSFLTDDDGLINTDETTLGQNLLV